MNAPRRGLLGRLLWSARVRHNLARGLRWGRRRASARRDLHAARQRVPAIISRLGAATGEPSNRFSVHRVALTRSGVAVVDVGPPEAPTVVIKLSRRPSARTGLQREARVLRIVHNHPRHVAFAPLVPRPLLCGDQDGWGFLAEERRSGRPADVSSWPDPRPLIVEAAITIDGLHRTTAQPVVVDHRLVDRWVRGRVRNVRGLLGPADTGRSGRRLELLETALVEAIQAKPADVGWIHGDFWTGNLLFSDDGRVVAILDWDSVRTRELPQLDLLHLIVTARRVAARRPWGDSMRDLLAGSGLRADERQILDRKADCAPWLDPRTALQLYWLQAVESSVHRHPQVARSRPWVEANVIDVLEASAPS